MAQSGSQVVQSVSMQFPMCAQVLSMQFLIAAKWYPTCPKGCPSVIHLVSPGGLRLICGHEIHILSNLSAVIRMPLYMLLLDRYDLKELGGVWSIIGQDG